MHVLIDLVLGFLPRKSSFQLSILEVSFIVTKNIKLNSQDKMSMKYMWGSARFHFGLRKHKQDCHFGLRKDKHANIRYHLKIWVMFELSRCQVSDKGWTLLERTIMLNQKLNNGIQDRYLYFETYRYSK